MKKIIFAAAILSAAVMTGCSLSLGGTESSQPAESVQGGENAVTTETTKNEENCDTSEDIVFDAMKEEKPLTRLKRQRTLRQCILKPQTLSLTNQW